LIADKAYDTNRLRTFSGRAPGRSDHPIECKAQATAALIGSATCSSACSLDFRHIATRYDKLDANFLAGVVLAATVICWT